ncbi:MAG: zinc-ribbon domain-containing protein [Proteobacteria bacterium]|nr:zinc-ribbon domain-containing protein [Cystobacterineae bacterium]MCL2259569.1 zinc-ribbon domain-containing protein [Cystobacterineae bacterium]MCL2313949.1 zinc-ribbon domain-containing protein [Pseudomonadota bacterium]
MIVKCEQCKTRFRLADERVPPSGARVRCARCRHVFRVHRLAAPQPQPYVPQPSVEDELPPHAKGALFSQAEDDPFAYFGEPAQASTSEPTRPGIFLPGLGVSRRKEESKALMQPPRVPVFGASDGVNIPKLFAEKLAAAQGGGARAEMPEVSGAGPFQSLREGGSEDATQTGYHALHQRHGEAASDKTQKVLSFSSPSEAGEGGDSGWAADQEASGNLSDLLSAESEDMVQDRNESEIRRANESEIRRAFVQSKTKVERRKGLRRFLKILLLLLVLTMAVVTVALLLKYGWGGLSSFSWERVRALWATTEAEGGSGMEWVQVFHIDEGVGGSRA